MEYTVFNELIAGLGFPIAVCVALFWSNRKTVEHYEKILLKFDSSINRNTEVMNRNTEVMNRLIVRIEDKTNV